MTAVDATASRARGALNEWLRGRVAAWTELGPRIERLQQRERVDVAEAVEAAVDYRRIGRDLALAQQLNAPQSTTSFLARQYAGLHQALTRPVGRTWPDLVTLLQQTVPSVMRTMRARIFWVAMLMFGTASTELAPGQWVDLALTHIVGMRGILLLVFVSGLMFVMRHFAGPLAHRLSPVGLLLMSSIFALAGLNLLSVASSPATAIAASAIWGIGVCYETCARVGVAL